MNKDEAVKIAYTIAADVISPDRIEAIINEHQHLLPGSEQDKQLVAAALRVVQIELLEKAEAVDDEELSDEEIALASIKDYLDENGKIDFDKMRAEAVIVKAQEVDVMTAEEEAEIDAILDKYRGADGKLDYDLLRKNSGPLPEDLQAEFDAIAYDEDSDSG